MKNILYLIKTPPPITGATLMNQRVYDSQLLREHFSIRSICISYSNSVENFGRIGWKKVVIIIRVFIRLFYELFFHRPNLVYIQISPLGIAFFRDLLLVTLIKLFHVKIVFHLRSKGIDFEAKKRLKKVLYKYVFKNQYIICLSHKLTHDVKHVFDGKIYIVNNGIPDDSKKLKGISFTKYNSVPTLLFLSNLIVTKGIIDYLDALEMIHKRGIQFHGLIIGAEGDLSKQQLISKIEERNLLKSVRYLGAKYGTEKLKAIYLSDIFIFPTKNDCFPGVVIEAMQFGKPVITTNEGAIPEIVDENKTGFVTSPNSPNEIAAKIEILILNPDKRKEFGVNGRKKYEENYTLKHFENRMTEVFFQILKDLK